LTLKLDVFMVAGRLFCIRCGNILF
jgi:hypothetical protein